MGEPSLLRCRARHCEELLIIISSDSLRLLSSPYLTDAEPGSERSSPHRDDPVAGLQPRAVCRAGLRLRVSSPSLVNSPHSCFPPPLLSCLSCPVPPSYFFSSIILLLPLGNGIASIDTGASPFLPAPWIVWAGPVLVQVRACRRCPSPLMVGTVEGERKPQRPG